MNGFSDVRLTLHSQELAAGQINGTREVMRNAPPCLGRWGMFWLRLRTRRALLDLTPQALEDIGLSREQARQEALKPFWRV
ncbi:MULTISPECIES: DUF1127 domain-containing protein [unclassified Pseudomonas]|uniref:DUF1127 domain-containing protein n=1 Tax=unclassified Pseudomonas TaxID=196821 RepID=UPI002AC99293|nr:MULTISPECIES: DUF1127 domain-containing protein [unclassified Pseudomonas]MEB0043843.1 DUF1127 domain-containing protein [Pseudomonas sp. Dout3]MEB0095219.1 DUF1127 domain-containing protein [Pseudomonas sp. DC1.2]WPX58776.1 DUF1127 domain-containing protein [Pseudomonas sp. DC1.2]